MITPRFKNDEDFVVTVLYPYQQQDMKQLTLRQHERIKVIQTHESGWWIGENSAKEVGLFPANYVQRLVSDFVFHCMIALY
jgi:hypothetical protein